MVFGWVTSDGDVVQSFIFSYGQTLNTDAIIKSLEELVLTYIVSNNLCLVTELWF